MLGLDRKNTKSQPAAAPPLTGNVAAASAPHVDHRSGLKEARDRHRALAAARKRKADEVVRLETAITDLDRQAGAERVAEFEAGNEPPVRVSLRERRESAANDLALLDDELRKQNREIERQLAIAGQEVLAGMMAEYREIQRAFFLALVATIKTLEPLAAWRTRAECAGVRSADIESATIAAGFFGFPVQDIAVRGSLLVATLRGALAIGALRREEIPEDWRHVLAQ